MTKKPTDHARTGGTDSSIEHWLKAIGVHSRQDLVRLGSIHAYRLMKGQGFEVTLHHVYVMEGVILGVEWDKIPERLKGELEAAISVEGAG